METSLARVSCAPLALSMQEQCYTFRFEQRIGGASVPLYEYKCLKCGRTTEKIENVSGPHLKKCPHCGGKVEPVIKIGRASCREERRCRSRKKAGETVERR